MNDLSTVDSDSLGQCLRIDGSLNIGSKEAVLLLDLSSLLRLPGATPEVLVVRRPQYRARRVPRSLQVGLAVVQPGEGQVAAAADGQVWGEQVFNL